VRAHEKSPPQFSRWPGPVVELLAEMKSLERQLSAARRAGDLVRVEELAARLRGALVALERAKSRTVGDDFDVFGRPPAA
jgi:hypothetical protein